MCVDMLVLNQGHDVCVAVTVIEPGGINMLLTG